jgi:signal transduction histidine kinase/ActR/RegA family two-component response regulator
MARSLPSVVSRSRGWRPRLLSFLVFLLLAVGTTATSVAVARVTDDQEQRLLDQQVRAAGALVSSAFGGSLSSFQLLGALAQPEIGSPALFRAVAQPLVTGGGRVVVAREASGGPEVVASEGVAAGEEALDSRARSLVARATTADDFVSDVMPSGDQRRLMIAVKAAASADLVVYAEFLIGEQQLVSGPNEPFSELDGTVYVGTRADPSRALFSTAADLSGRKVARQTVEVGSDRWLLVVAPKQPLVGSLAERLPWLVFAAGFLAALLTAALVELISRRRGYALRLVDERTRELRLALEEKERLEGGQRVAREAAEAANHSKSEFLSRMSHELRTPLNAILGFAQLLAADDLTPEQRDATKQILRGGRHLLDLINEVLDITRIEAGNFQISPEAVAVGDLVDEVVELTRPLAEKAQIVVTVDGTCVDDFVLADVQRLKQVLLNLLGNAVKYNRLGGTVAVWCSRRDPARLRISVRDTGLGIRPEQCDLLFVPFERLGAERTHIEGTGVGLALSRRLAEAMGGTVDVETEFGQGSTFWVELPLVEGPVQRFERLVPQPPAGSSTSPPLTRRRVLYVEDNLSNLQLVQQVFGAEAQVDLRSATQGQAGLELARDLLPDVVLLDLHLPDMSGDEVLRQLRDDPRTSAIPVVMITADATAGQTRRLLAEGASAYLTKPIDVAELRRVVAELAQRRDGSGGGDG